MKANQEYLVERYNQIMIDPETNIEYDWKTQKVDSALSLRLKQKYENIEAQIKAEYANALKPYLSSSVWTPEAALEKVRKMYDGKILTFDARKSSAKWI